MSLGCAVKVPFSCWANRTLGCVGLIQKGQLLLICEGATSSDGGISLGRGSQGTSSLPLGSEEFQGIPEVPPSS